tara:strand:- start:110 stop:484 length:375 start_codon:yes stop_codon:yes gene_type:complete
MNYEKEMQAFMEAIAREERVDLLSAQQTLEMLAEYADQTQDKLKEYDSELVKAQNGVTKTMRDMKAIAREIKGQVPDQLYETYMRAYDYVRKLNGSFDLAYTELASALNDIKTVEREADKLSRG